MMFRPKKVYMFVK